MAEEKTDRSDDQWAQELLAIGGEEHMTPKQIAILKAAVEVFAEKGYAGAATSEIAQKAGVAEGTVFRYYKTKKDLLISIIGPTMGKLLAPFIIRNFGSVLNSPYETYEDFLRAFIVNRLDFARNNFKLLKILVQEIPFHPSLREQFVENVMNTIVEKVSLQLERFKEKGQIADVPTSAAIRFSASAALGFIMTRLLFQPDKDWNDEEEVEILIRLIMHGLSPK
ncbi:TetR family transcriptional regulator [Paenibacillus stellifer]|uniref:TetR family transcriptional regulator n=1 Tax=Paenibacillus stellifer TaxID=169760 RepID=A0A089N8Q0_9BACL|nr:TetR/AcrR family transcriptional regulator [Paenibacillus stellifer]AIQ65189.1 TetR family transcriptional regulator [Paenibacillus stellifer]